MREIVNEREKKLYVCVDNTPFLVSKCIHGCIVEWIDDDNDDDENDDDDDDDNDDDGR